MSSAKRIRKVVTIGLDGLEPSIVESMMTRGELPHLSSLKDSGGYARLGTTAPAQTPVAWSTFATGLNPGEHGIFDFLRRDPQSYLPQIGLNRFEQKNAFLPPKLVNAREGETIWERLGNAGNTSAVIRCPCSYPPKPFKGRMLAGMGVPDMRGSFGVPSYYTSGPQIETGESETVLPLKRNGHPSIETRIPGPVDPKTRQPMEAPIEFDVSGGRVTVRNPQQSAEMELQQGIWSDWLPVSFKRGFLQWMHGMVRFLLVQTEPDLEIYASPVNFDPARPPFPISTPEEYSEELAQAIGTYYTTGFVEDHTGLINSRIDEAAFLDQCSQAWNEREAMLFHELNYLDEGFLYCLFDTPDRIQHMFWRYREPDHPANIHGQCEEFRNTIEEQYIACDRTIGKVKEYVDDETLLIVLSDHGFNSYRRGLHLNTWLHDQGLLALEDGLKPGVEAGDYLRRIDWSRTQAYSLGLGGIYLNLAGRESEGAVSPGLEAEQLEKQISENLTGLKDPDTGERSVNRVVSKDKIYRGPRTEEAPDLLVLFNRGYRASWETASGGVPEGWFADNVKRWSGDHVIDPDLVPGVLFMNRSFRTDKPEMQDLAPTILKALDAPIGTEMQGKALLP